MSDFCLSDEFFCLSQAVRLFKITEVVMIKLAIKND